MRLPHRTTIRVRALMGSTSPLRFAENRETAGTRLCPCFGLRRATTGKSLPSASKTAVMQASSQTTLRLRPNPQVEEPRSIAGDPAAVKDITEFYQTWIVKRDVIQASAFASPRSYACLAAPSEDQKKLTPIARIQSGLQQPLARIPSGANLSDMMSSLQPSNDLLRPVQQENSNAFAMMAVPDQKADSFLCQRSSVARRLSGLEAR